MQSIVLWKVNNKNPRMIWNPSSMRQEITLDRSLLINNWSNIINDELQVDFDDHRCCSCIRFVFVAIDLDPPTEFFSKPSHLIEETLRPFFESHYKSVNFDDWNSMKYARSLALISALATIFKRCDIKKCGNIPLEKIPKFLDREQRRLLGKLQRTAPVKKVDFFGLCLSLNGSTGLSLFRFEIINSMNNNSSLKPYVKSASNLCGELIIKDISVDVN